jgi:hypothetical protein
MAAIHTHRLSLPAPVVLAESTLLRLRQEGAQGDLIEPTRFWQAVGALVGTQGGFGPRAKHAIRRAGIETQGFQLALCLTTHLSIREL